MTTRFAAKLTALDFELPEWCVPPSEQLVHEYEKRFELTLTPDYREFLVNHGGVIGTANCDFQEPTPCGTGTCIDILYGFTRPGWNDNVADMTQLIEGAPDVVAIGANVMGAMFWLKCSGRDSGNVYMHDHEGRSAWTDEMFSEMFENLHPAIEEYLDLRKRRRLPEKPKGYEHVYRIANSFSEFVESLQKAEE